MRKITAISIVGFVICTAFIKPTTKPASDYRDAYTGSYFCMCTQTQMESTGQYTRMDTASIVISKDAKDSILQVKTGSSTLKVKLIKKVMRTGNPGIQCGGYFFSTDSLSFGFALSPASSCKYRGKKR